MKFLFVINKTPLMIAIEQQNLEIAQLLLACDDIDVNVRSILTFFIF